MRSNSGKDESRNNMDDQTMRDHTSERQNTGRVKLKAPADHRQGRQD